MLQSNANSNGQLSSYIPPKTPLTYQRENAVEALQARATDQSELDKWSSLCAVENIEPIRDYIIYNGEVPKNDPTLALIQASLIRAGQIAYVCDATGLGQEQSLLVIESEENERRELNQLQEILPVDVMAVIYIINQCQCDKLQKRYSTDSIVDLVSFLSNGSVTNWSELIGNVMQDEPEFNEQYWLDQSIQIRTGQIPDNADGKSTVLSDVINGLINQVKAPAQAAANDIATKSLKQAIMDNLPLILGIALAIGVIIFVSIYVAKRSKS